MQDADNLSSGNIFEDMGMADAEKRLAKAELARALRRAMHARGLDHADASRMLGVSLGDVNDLLRGRLSRFTEEQLQGLLVAISPSQREGNEGT